jgi:hypothetical protein
LRFAEPELKLRFINPALKNVAGNYFPIDDIEIALSGLTYANVVEAGKILDDEDENNKSPMSKYYEKVADIEYDQIEAAGQLRNILFHRLLLPKSNRSSIKSDSDHCSAYEWFQMLKSRFTMWHIMVEIGQYEYKMRKEEEEMEEEDSDEEEGRGETPGKPDKLQGVKIPDSAAKALKLAIKLNTNVAGGGPKFKAFLDKARGECRILTKPIERAIKVFKANSSGKSKQILKDLLFDNNRGGVTEDASEENDTEEDATADENDVAEENETAVNSPEDEESEAEFSEEDDDDDDEYEADDIEQFQVVKKKGPPPRDKAKDASKMEEIMTCANPAKNDTVVLQKFLKLLTGRDLDSLHAAITKTFRNFWTSEDLLQYVTTFELLTSQIPKALLDSFLVPSFDFGSLTTSEKVMAFKVLCDFHLLHDVSIQSEVKDYEKAEIVAVPKFFDAMGRGYFYFAHLQPLAGCRLYRTIGSWNTEGGQRKVVKIKDSSKAR